jgi:hypothetical protein
MWYAGPVNKGSPPEPVVAIWRILRIVAPTECDAEESLWLLNCLVAAIQHEASVCYDAAILGWNRQLAFRGE